MKILFGTLALLIIVFGLMQLVPVDRSNPPVAADIPTPPEVKSILRRACYDCHSHETVWPWYSRIAPFSWLIARDVQGGRAELNFSTWTQYSTKEQVKKMKESFEEVAEGEMPPWFYLAVHRDASLSEADRKVLRMWAVSTIGTSVTADD